jgi:hypothetical protein
MLSTGLYHNDSVVQEYLALTALVRAAVASTDPFACHSLFKPDGKRVWASVHA